MKRILSWIASGLALSVVSGLVAGASVPATASAATDPPSCYKAANGAKVCVTIATPTPAPTPTPRVVYRVVKIPVRVPVLQREVVVKKVPVVKRVVQHPQHVVSDSSSAAYPSGAHRLPNGFYELPADGRTYDVACNPQAFCLFLFPKGAKITARAVQDAHDWDVPFTTYGPDDRAMIAVKVTSTEPFAYPGHKPHDLHTQLVVTTDKSKWPYIVSLHTSSKAPMDGTKIAFQDSQIADDLGPQRRVADVPPWRSSVAAIATTAPPTPTPAPTLPPVGKPCSLEGPTLYFVRGAADFAPTNVFDDTLGHTCIAFPKNMENAPVVLETSPSAGDESVNSYPWSAGLFVTGTPDVLILQDGSGKGSQRVYLVKDKRSTTTTATDTAKGSMGL